MPALDLPSGTADFLADDLVEIGVYPTHALAADRGLVVLASGHPYWLLDATDGVRLLVERSAEPVARLQLAAYERESTHWPPPPIADPWTPGRGDFITPLLWATVVLGLFYVGERSPAWLDRGVLDPRAVLANGEWWRVATALFLHADAAHVLSNVLGGLLVFSAVLSTFGRLRGWILLLLAAVGGNVMIVLASRIDRYLSLGASTAIFAGVGLLAGRAVRLGWRSSHPHRWRALLTPLATGLIVLALYGAGEQRVDVGAHLAGFLAGLVLGFLVRIASPRDDDPPLGSVTTRKGAAL